MPKYIASSVLKNLGDLWRVLVGIKLRYLSFEPTLTNRIKRPARIINAAIKGICILFLDCSHTIQNFLPNLVF